MIDCKNDTMHRSILVVPCCVVQGDDDKPHWVSAEDGGGYYIVVACPVSLSSLLLHIEESGLQLFADFLFIHFLAYSIINIIPCE